MTDSFTGVLAVKDCDHIVDLTLRSTRHALDRYIVYDNLSTDETREVVQETADEYDLDIDLRVAGGNSGELYQQAIESVGGYAVRLEGDQVYFPDRFSACLDAVRPGKLTLAQSYFIRNRLDLTRSAQQVNGPHATVYPRRVTLVIKDGDHLPVARGSPSLHYDESPISVNLNIDSPADRLRNWHWRHSKWWTTQEDIPEEFVLDGCDPPYNMAFTLDEYIWCLKEQGKGAAKYGWEGDTLEEVGEDFVRWDIGENCATYDGPLPLLVDEHRDRFEAYYV